MYGARIAVVHEPFDQLRTQSIRLLLRGAVSNQVLGFSGITLEVIEPFLFVGGAVGVLPSPISDSETLAIAVGSDLATCRNQTCRPQVVRRSSRKIQFPSVRVHFAP